MDDILDEIEKPYEDVNEDNLIWKIWLKPKVTIRYIMDHCPHKYVSLFMALAGMVNTFGRMINKEPNERISIAIIVPVSIILGGALGWISFYILSITLDISGRWLKGNTNGDKFHPIVAWAAIPVIFTLPLLVFQYFYFGDDLFLDSLSIKTLDGSLLVLLVILGIGLRIWALVILVAGVAEVQKFSNQRALVNVFLAGCIIIIPLILFALLLALFFSSK